MKSSNKYPTKNAYTKIYEQMVGGDWLAEFPFHPTRKFRFDYALPELKIAVEVDGGLFNAYMGKHAGRHSGGMGQKTDMEKGNLACADGWLVFHFIPDEMFAFENRKLLEQAIALRKSKKDLEK
jgi:very-short-patch-repair endonuclease